MTNLLLLSCLFCVITIHTNTCVTLHRQNIGRQPHQKRPLGFSEIDIRGSVSPKMRPPPPFPPSWENSDNKLAFFYVRA